MRILLKLLRKKMKLLFSLKGREAESYNINSNLLIRKKKRKGSLELNMSLMIP
jgi:hypothetical protein